MMGAPISHDELNLDGSGLQDAAAEPQPADELAVDEVELDELPADPAPAPPELPAELQGEYAVTADDADLEELEELDQLEEIPGGPVAGDQATIDEVADEVAEPAEGEFQLEEDSAAGAEHAPLQHPASHASSSPGDGEPLELDEITTPTEEIEPVDLEAADSEWDFVVEESDAEHSPHNFQVDLDSTHEQPHGKA
jgi:hypothetical protein